MSNKDDQKQKTSGLVEIRDMLKGELNKFSTINLALKETTEGFNKIDSTYTNYGSEIDVSRNHIMKLKRREFFENLFVYIGFVIYLCCVAYVLLKRFPIHRLVYLAYFIVEYIVSVIYSSKGIIDGYFKGGNNTLYDLNNTLLYNISNYTTAYSEIDNVYSNNVSLFSNLTIYEAFSNNETMIIEEL